jgi:hypothetical protein
MLSFLANKLITYWFVGYEFAGHHVPDGPHCFQYPEYAG